MLRVATCPCGARHRSRWSCRGGSVPLATHDRRGSRSCRRMAALREKTPRLRRRYELFRCPAHEGNLPDAVLCNALCCLIGNMAVLSGAATHGVVRRMTQLESTLTCPTCREPSTETMLTNACQFFYNCPHCKAVLRPLAGDCCVFCSYGDVPCPPIQQANESGEGASCCGN